MKKLFISLFVFSCGLSYAQKDVYTLTSGEFVFGWSDMKRSGNPLETDMRFTAFLHLGEYVHFDFNNHFGLYTGAAIRNVGIITKDPEFELDPTYEKVVRRSYNLGVPVAFKLGNFDKHIYLFGGGEYELLFHYKEKVWIDGEKQKSSKWFSNKTNRFVPSVFGGIQFEGGLHLMFKYYLGDFLNSSYKKGDVDYSSIDESRLFYVSLSWQFKPDQLFKKTEKEFFETAWNK